jgi:hypothetical protein
LRARVGELDEVTQEQIRVLPNQKLEELGVALLNFTTRDDLQQWLREHVAAV